jgi:hypothetical protein
MYDLNMLFWVFNSNLCLLLMKTYHLKDNYTAKSLLSLALCSLSLYSTK